MYCVKIHWSEWEFFFKAINFKIHIFPNFLMELHTLTSLSQINKNVTKSKSTLELPAGKSLSLTQPKSAIHTRHSENNLFKDSWLQLCIQLSINPINISVYVFKVKIIQGSPCYPRIYSIAPKLRGGGGRMS